MALVAAASGALAADVGPVITPGPFDAPPAYVTTKIYDWTGFYIGINGGAAFGNIKWGSAPDAVSGTSNISGGLAGGTAGYNLQTGQPFVVGVEADADWSGIRATVSPASCAPNCDFKVPWLGTARLRVGWAFNALMPYLTGGVAFGALRASSAGAPLGTGTADTLGWTAGVGIEFALTGELRAKVEYLYVNLGGFSCFAACGGGPISFNANNASIIRAGLNYRLWTN